MVIARLLRRLVPSTMSRSSNERSSEWGQIGLLIKVCTKDVEMPPTSYPASEVNMGTAEF
jgi:hypothetical protein